MFNEDQKLKMVNLYLSGKTQKEISKLFNCSQRNISNILKNKNIKCRNRKDVFKNKFYNDINLNFFKEINSEESAYFLGLLYADGCIQIKNNQYCTSLKLKSSDKHIIEKFKNIISPSSKIKSYFLKNNSEYCYFRINQKEFCQQLIFHGCIPNKSLTLNFPATVPNQFIKYFIKGYSDGDGSIYVNKFKNKKYVNYIWKITSTKQFCNSLAIILKNTLNINCHQEISKKNKITTTLSVGGNNQVKKLLDWIYQDSNIHLIRKYNKYLEFKDYLSSSKSRSVFNSSSTDKSSETSRFNKSKSLSSALLK